MEYVILSTPEEDALSNYFLMLSRFAFDTARDQAVRGRCMMQLVPCRDRIGKGKVVLQQEGATGHLSWPHYLIWLWQRSSIILWSCISFACLKRKRWVNTLYANIVCVNVVVC